MHARLLCCFALVAAAAVAFAVPPASRGLGEPGKLQALSVATGAEDGSVDLVGRDAGHQLLVLGKYADGQTRDLSRTVSYEAKPVGIVQVDATGYVTPVGDGDTNVTVKGPQGLNAAVSIRVRHFADYPVNFPGLIVPGFTKLGCNTGGCHGKAGGQNGFKLSLFGFEPDEDHEHLVKEARGRRLFPAAPEKSLLLQKGAGIVPHGGGVKFDYGSPFYATVRRWIEQGTPYTQPDDPTVVKIEVVPGESFLPQKSQQQILVLAHLSNGRKMDVTRWTTFEANQADLAEVSPTGLVTTKERIGTGAIMARYQLYVDVYRATVPLGATLAALPPTKNFIDELVFKRLKTLGLPPSELADDATFLRRATVDIAGRLPTRSEVETYVADKNPGKVEALVDRLLASDDYAYYFANKWGAILRNRREKASDDPAPTQAFHEWILQGLKDNKPYDAFVRDVLTAAGEEIKTPAVVWYRAINDPTAQVEDVAQLFLGQRIACARCHHHPLEKWTQQDYFGFSAFFAQTEVKIPPPPKKPKKDEPAPVAQPATVTHKKGLAKATNPKTNLPVRPMGLADKELRIAAEDDPRAHLAQWVSDPANPFFAKALVNRYWKHFFSRGLVDPEDDMRATNPATNPELLAALAQRFAEKKFDLKDLVRTLCTSNAYRLSAVPNEFNADDRQNFSRYLPKRLNAEVLLDAVDEVTLTKTNFKGLPANTKAVQLPDNQFESYFLGVFGRPDSASACECERSSDASLAQCLHMFNSTEIMQKIGGKNAKSRAIQLSADKRPHAARLQDLYLVALSREPSAEELSRLEAYITKKNDPQVAYEDIVWAVLNTKEFLFNH